MKNENLKTVFSVLLVSQSEAVTLVSVNPQQPPDNSSAKKAFLSEILADEIVDLYNRTGTYLAVQKVKMTLSDPSEQNLN